VELGLNETQSSSAKVQVRLILNEVVKIVKLTVVDYGISDCDIVRTVNIPTVRIGWNIGRVGVRMNVDPIVCDILALVNEVVLKKVSTIVTTRPGYTTTYPERRVDEVDVLHQHVCRIAYGQRNWPLKGR